MKPAKRKYWEKTNYYPYNNNNKPLFQTGNSPFTEN